MSQVPALPRFAAAADGHLTDDMKAAFDRDGVLLLEDFAGADQCLGLIERMQALVDAADLSEVTTIFTTTDARHAGDAYFAGSGDKIRFFFEDGAFDGQGKLNRPKDRALNKVGHGMHDLDPVFDGFSRQPKLRALAAGLGFRRPLLLQSMYIFKQPGIGGEVVCHTDFDVSLHRPAELHRPVVRAGRRDDRKWLHVRPARPPSRAPEIALPPPGRRQPRQ